MPTPSDGGLVALNYHVLNEMGEAGAHLRECLSKLAGCLYDLTANAPNDLDERTHVVNAAAQVSTIMQSLFYQYGQLAKFVGDERMLRATRDQKDVARKIMAFIGSVDPERDERDDAGT